MTAVEKSKRFQKLDFNDHPEFEPLVRIQNLDFREVYYPVKTELPTVSKRFAALFPEAAKRVQVTTLESSARVVTPAAPKTTSPKEGIYKVTVDYRKTSTEMIAAGHYDYVNNDIITDRFTNSGSGVVECALELIYLDERVKTPEVLQHVDKQGMRPAKLPEFLALGAAHPDLQRQFPLMVFGPVWAYPFGRRPVAYLHREASLRVLYFSWSGDDNVWSGGCRFVAVRK